MDVNRIDIKDGSNTHETLSNIADNEDDSNIGKPIKQEYFIPVKIEINTTFIVECDSIDESAKILRNILEDDHTTYNIKRCTGGEIKGPLNSTRIEYGLPKPYKKVCSA